jgi:hypothetical protein
MAIQAIILWVANYSSTGTVPIKAKILRVATVLMYFASGMVPIQAKILRAATSTNALCGAYPGQFLWIATYVLYHWYGAYLCQNPLG